MSKTKLLYDCKVSNERTSLAIFKPNKLLNFYIDESNNKENLPYKFYYSFADNEGRISNLQIIDWEIGELTRKLLRQYKGNYEKIKGILKQKYFYEMQQKDIYLFLGTNKIWHIRKSSNPFMIIGVFYPPKIQ